MLQFLALKVTSILFSNSMAFSCLKDSVHLLKQAFKATASVAQGSRRLLGSRIALARDLIYSYNIATLGNLLKLRELQSLIYMWGKISISQTVKDNEMLHIQKLGQCLAPRGGSAPAGAPLGSLHAPQYPVAQPHELPPSGGSMLTLTNLIYLFMLFLELGRPPLLLVIAFIYSFI